MQCLCCRLNSTDVEQGPVVVSCKHNVWGTQELRVSWTHARLSASQKFYSKQFDTCSKQMPHCGLVPFSPSSRAHRPFSADGNWPFNPNTPSFGCWLVSCHWTVQRTYQRATSRTNHTRKPYTQLAVSWDPKWRMSSTLRLDKNINIAIVTHLTVSWWASITLKVQCLSALTPVPLVTKAQSLCKLSTNDLVRQEWSSAKQLPGSIIIQGFPKQRYKTRCWQTNNNNKKSVHMYIKRRYSTGPLTLIHLQ